MLNSFVICSALSFESISVGDWVSAGILSVVIVYNVFLHFVFRKEESKRIKIKLSKSGARLAKQDE